MITGNKQIQNSTITQEKSECLDLFHGYLVDLLDSKSELLDELNEDLINLLLTDQGVKKELENVLYENQEKLGNSAFGPAAISSWLKDFIQKNGSNIFSNLILTQYIANSENAKKLNEEEKKLLTKLLILFRNIKFFPESMGSQDPEDWEIIPSGTKQEGRQGKDRTLPERPKNAQDKKLKELQEIAEQFAPGTLERRAVEEEIRKLGN